MAYKNLGIHFKCMLAYLTESLSTPKVLFIFSKIWCRDWIKSEQLFSTL